MTLYNASNVIKAVFIQYWIVTDRQTDRQTTYDSVYICTMHNIGR